MLPLISIPLLLSLLLLGTTTKMSGKKQDLDKWLICIVFPVLSRQGCGQMWHILTGLNKVLAFNALPCTVHNP